MRISEEEFQRRFPNQAIKTGTAISPLERYQACIETNPNKFHAVMCEADGIKFSSKKERRRYLELMALKSAGECWFLRQVPFYLPGTKYIIDFIVFWKDGKISFEDVKGKRLPMYILKKKQVELFYPIKIQEI